MPLLRLTPALTAVGLSCLLVASCGGGGGETETFKVPSPAMEPTLSVGDTIRVDTGAYEEADPQTDDIIVFHPPSGAVRGPACGVRHASNQSCPRPRGPESREQFVKRIVAGPGDRLSIAKGAPIVNGKVAHENFTKPCNSTNSMVRCDLRKPITLGPNAYFLLGDNRGKSDDSRIWGPIPSNWIVGKVVG